jgi:predicted CoA-substrate-specific enzyme activase
VLKKTVFAGIDVGSMTTKAAIVDEAGSLVGRAIRHTGADGAAAAESALGEALASASRGRDELGYLVATGYGRGRVEGASAAVTEITCHARGAVRLLPSTRTVVDIGGQDSKAIRIDERGRVLAFQMNDKCAAGTGRFLEVMARALEIELKDLGPLSLKGRDDLRVSSVCTVFAESEVVGLIAAGRSREDIILAIHNAVADRTEALVARVGLKTDLTVTGGVAKNTGLMDVLTRRLGVALRIPAEPQIAGALGAALIARERAA